MDKTDVGYIITGNTATAAKSLQLCPTLCDPIDGSPPGSSVHGIFQARTLEWGAIAFSDRAIPLSHKKEGSDPLGATRMNLKIVVLSEASQRKTVTIWYHLMRNLKN